MSKTDIVEMVDKARELGLMVSSADTTGCKPLDLLALCAMCQALDNFITHFEGVGKC